MIIQFTGLHHTNNSTCYGKPKDTNLTYLHLGMGLLQEHPFFWVLNNFNILTLCPFCLNIFYRYIYIQSSKGRLFHCITTLQCGQTVGCLKPGLKPAQLCQIQYHTTQPTSEPCHLGNYKALYIHTHTYIHCNPYLLYSPLN